MMMNIPVLMDLADMGLGRRCPKMYMDESLYQSKLRGGSSYHNWHIKDLNLV